MYIYIYVYRGSKGYYVAPRTHLVEDVYNQNSGNAIYSYQVRCMHVHVVAPGQRFYG
jgi:hypothetical protein